VEQEFGRFMLALSLFGLGSNTGREGGRKKEKGFCRFCFLFENILKKKTTLNKKTTVLLIN
jgi:hypothetical protein